MCILQPVQPPADPLIRDASLAPPELETRWAVAYWLLLVVVLIGVHAEFYFQTPYYEARDFGANALQIRDAKRFEELHGNYSRFGFNHPGPAFFYVYALGEAVFFDLLKAFPAPFNAHVFTNVLLQTFFFVWAVWIVSRRTRLSGIPPLLLIFAAIHFGLVNHQLPDSAFQSIWPAHFLLLPFVCFLVAAASVAAGSERDLAPFALAGGFLAHGHVEQILFVVPLAVLALGAFLVAAAREKRLMSRAVLLALARAAGIISVFLLPLVIDALRGADSNLQLILHQLSAQKGERKTVAQSVVYFLTFLCRVRTPHQYADKLTDSSLAFLSAGWPFIMMWAVVIGGAAALLRAPHRSESRPDRRFVRWLWIIFPAAVLLTLWWGVLQSGSMYGFNSYFNFAILFMPWILLAIGVARHRRIEENSRFSAAAYLIGAVLFAAAVGNFSRGPDFREYTQSDTREFVRQIETAARQDPQSSRTKLLLFDAADRQWAVGVALALERAGYAYAVPPEWFVQFGAEHVVDPAAALAAGDVALWRVRRAQSPQDHWITNSPPDVDPTTGSIQFAGPGANIHSFAVLGWERPQESFSWSVGNRALLYFGTPPTSSDIELQIELLPLPNTNQRVLVRFNEGAPTELRVSARTVATVHISAADWNRRRTGALLFEFPDAVSPQEIALKPDSRRPACGFIAIHFRPTSVPGT